MSKRKGVQNPFFNPQNVGRTVSWSSDEKTEETPQTETPVTQHEGTPTTKDFKNQFLNPLTMGRSLDWSSDEEPRQTQATHHKGKNTKAKKRSKKANKNKTPSKSEQQNPAATSTASATQVAAVPNNTDKTHDPYNADTTSGEESDWIQCARPTSGV